MHKCRVFKDRWNGRWYVKCYLTDTYVGKHNSWIEAMRDAFNHCMAYSGVAAYDDHVLWMLRL